MGEEEDPFWKKLAVFDFKLRIVLSFLIVIIVFGSMFYSNVILPQTCPQKVDVLSRDGPDIKDIDFEGAGFDSLRGDPVGDLLRIRTDSPVRNIAVYEEGERIEQEEFDEPEKQVTVENIQKEQECSEFRIVLNGEKEYLIRGQIDRRFG